MTFTHSQTLILQLNDWRKTKAGEYSGHWTFCYIASRESIKYKPERISAMGRPLAEIKQRIISDVIEEGHKIYRVEFNVYVKNANRRQEIISKAIRDLDLEKLIDDSKKT